MAGVLYVAEPLPLVQGGGDYEQVDLDTLTASNFPVDTGAEVGGFEVIKPDLYWLITHTDFGPGASSHLNLVGGLSTETYNPFASEHVDDLALDLVEDLLSDRSRECVSGVAGRLCTSGAPIVMDVLVP